VEFPLHLAELGDALPLIDAGVGQVAAKHGSILAEGRHAEEERGEQRTASDFHAE